ncbi:MAG: alanine--tRNA ligase [Gammaproteobacteria bacterium]|nr:alanine--tRNA ligase [Gammaproteobacteria bacterium]
MRSQDIRKTFLEFFREKGHEVVSSSPLVPANDKTLLFTNAGMVQFKDVFLGMEKRDYKRATTSQKCVRAGGKHNDLENVGYTARHHTFFEMLGNFSFGDYFKEDAIQYAWELVTERFGLPKDKLLVTVYHSDEEAYNIWHNIVGLPDEKIIRIGDKYPDQPYNSDNFWQMGDTGPCGPCTEIFYDHGEHIWGGPPGSPEEDGDRFIEIWNLVFMQYDRQVDGEMIPLPKPSVDTGMGLERIAAILQDVHSNYEIDMFVALIKAAAQATNTVDLEHNSLKVLADHIRSVAFLLIDGVVPSNEGRGYVLRRIIRRAIRHGYKLEQKKPFFHKLVAALIDEMGEAYPDLREKQEQVEAQIKREEERFGRTIDSGMELLEADLASLSGNTISGETLFKLYDTYGFPVDLTADIARERNLNVDLDGYNKAMQRQVEQSQAGGSFKGKTLFKSQEQTDFYGYHTYDGQAEIKQVFVDYQQVDKICENESAVIVLDRTPFYGEMGGQIGDRGTIVTETGEFFVEDTQKQGKTYLHYGKLTKGELTVGQTADLQVQVERRLSIGRNHLATHVLHAALHVVLGKQALQKGSLVTDTRLRFDFIHDKPVTTDELNEIERVANSFILANHFVKTEKMPLEEARAKGALALFDEKYDDIVRVVTIVGCGSMELCGGTHSEHTGDVGQIIITHESGVAAGIRRIEAVTGWGALERHRSHKQLLDDLSTQLKASPENFEKKIAQIFENNKDLQKQIKVLKERALSGGENPFGNVREVVDFKVLTAQVEGYGANELRDLADQQRDKNDADLVVLATVENDKVKLVASVAKSAIDKLHAGKIIGQVAQVVDGRGGGRPDFAQAGGTNVNKVTEALAQVDTILQKL